MTTPESPGTLPDLLRQTREVDGEEVVYRFANGLTIKTEVLHKNDRMRILPLGSPQFALMNHLVAFPDVVRDKRVFEPFAGSGALGLMALKAGAAHVDFLDINPRAAAFHRENTASSELSVSQVTSITGDIAEFTPARKYDLLLANPPFIPTPDGIEGTLTSNGGSEGSRFIGILVDRLDALLVPGGKALVCAFQFVTNGEPLIVDVLAESLDRRPVALTPSQEHPIPFATYCAAYHELFPQHDAAIDRWESDLLRRHTSPLTLCHYVIEIGPRTSAPTRCVLRSDFSETFGANFRTPSDDVAALAFGRAFENFTAPVAASNR